jgi:hypothetical protein
MEGENIREPRHSRSGILDPSAVREITINTHPSTKSRPGQIRAKSKIPHTTDWEIPMVGRLGKN